MYYSLFIHFGDPLAGRGAARGGMTRTMHRTGSGSILMLSRPSLSRRSAMQPNPDLVCWMIPKSRFQVDCQNLAFFVFFTIIRNITGIRYSYYKITPEYPMFQDRPSWRMRCGRACRPIADPRTNATRFAARVILKNTKMGRF